MSLPRAIVLGAGHAGAQLVASLRQEGWAGEIVLLGAEPELPYQRPPLSKAYLSGAITVADLAIRGAEFYDKQRIEFRPTPVVGIDRSRRQVHLESGEAIDYDALALCTGARPRALPVPGADLAGVFQLRSIADIQAIRSLASAGAKAVLVGGGYIGLETAASLRKLGLEVTVLEAADRVLERVTAPVVSQFFTRIHREAGVQIQTGALVSAFAGTDRVREVVLATGERIPADLVILGVGVEPVVELAVAADLEVEDGVVIDDQARTSDPLIVAAGDCASHFLPYAGRRIRLESVPSAGEQAKVAAATLCGNHKTITQLPWFWSDQYDLKLQIAGLNHGYDEVQVDGDPTRDRDFVCRYYRAGDLVAADCVNRPRDFMATKRELAQRFSGAVA